MYVTQLIENEPVLYIFALSNDAHDFLYIFILIWYCILIICSMCICCIYRKCQGCCWTTHRGHSCKTQPNDRCWGKKSKRCMTFKLVAFLDDMKSGAKILRNSSTWCYQRIYSFDIQTGVTTASLISIWMSFPRPSQDWSEHGWRGSERKRAKKGRRGTWC